MSDLIASGGVALVVFSKPIRVMLVDGVVVVVVVVIVAFIVFVLQLRLLFKTNDTISLNMGGE